MDSIILVTVFFVGSLAYYLFTIKFSQKYKTNDILNLVENLNSGKYIVNKNDTIFIHRNENDVSLTYKNSFTESTYSFIFKTNRTINGKPANQLNQVILHSKKGSQVTYNSNVIFSNGEVSNNDHINKKHENIIDTANATAIFISKIKKIIKKNIKAI